MLDGGMQPIVGVEGHSGQAGKASWGVTLGRGWGSRHKQGRFWSEGHWSRFGECKPSCGCCQRGSRREPREMRPGEARSLGKQGWGSWWPCQKEDTSLQEAGEGAGGPVLWGCRGVGSAGAGPWHLELRLLLSDQRGQMTQRCCFSRASELPTEGTQHPVFTGVACLCISAAIFENSTVHVSCKVQALITRYCSLCRAGSDLFLGRWASSEL